MKFCVREILAQKYVLTGDKCYFIYGKGRNPNQINTSADDNTQINYESALVKIFRVYQQHVKYG